MHISYAEMEIDSLRHAMHKDEWLILLKDRAGQRYLPVYVDRDCADMVGKVLMGEKCDEGEFVDDDVQQMLAMGDEVSLVIDGYDKGIFHAECIMGWQGKPTGVKCSIGEVLAVCVKESGRIVVEESVLEEAGIAAGG